MGATKKVIVAIFGAAFLIGCAWMGSSAIAAISNSSTPLTGSTTRDAAPESSSPAFNAAGGALTRTRYEFSRVQSFTEWWQMPFLLVVSGLVLLFVAYMYRRDSVELKPGTGVLLALLRLAAFAGVLLMFLDVQRHTETKAVRNSRVVLLADTSLSMSRADADQTLPGSSGTTGDASGSAGGVRRIDQVADALADGRFIDALRQTHDVEMVKFDSDVRRIVTLPKFLPDEHKTEAVNRGADPSSSDTQTISQKESESDPKGADKIDWHKQLDPQGSETRIGQAVRQIINDERGMPLSGIVLFSDGGQNAGVDIAAAVKAAQEAKVPVHVVGVGSATRPTNVRVSDLVAPARAYPGDSFQVTCYLQSQGLADRTVTVELSVSGAGEGQGGKTEAAVDKTERVTLGRDSETVPVRFDIPGLDSAGRRVVRLRVKPIPEDKDPSDNQREVDVDIVDRKNRVLLFAGGPTREYQFVRNMLRRSELAKSGDMIVDVLLQSAGDGVSQDANQILSEFPHTMKDLAQYDTIVAFDPDWRELDPQQIELVEKWIGEESGGLIAIAGPVFTDAWVQAPAMATIRKLYPVEFNRRLALLEDARYGSQQPWPLDFTREGLEAEFLWLDDNATTSREVWDSFKGVFGYYRVRGPKLGATTYANYSDPEAATSDQKPVYFAGQFYGSGRVFYMGSGEMWRLRELDEQYFNSFYIKLIRHVSQGRLLRGSPLGNLLVERERYVVGNTVVVRAQLTNPQRQPLDVPKVTLQVKQLDGAPMSVALVADPTRKGMYSGQFTVNQEGECRLDLLHPDSPDQPLTRRLQVFMPKLEQEHPQRNDAVLKELADGTGGQLYIGVAAALATSGEKPLVKQLEDRTQEIYVAGQKDRKWEQQWMHWVLGIIAGCLCVEWLVRRLCRLA
jgi:hypothetical protein